MAKTDEYACRDLATEVNEMTDGRQTYNAVFGFLPGGTSTRPRNVSIASLMRLYCAERSGHKEDARREIKLRFHYLDYTIQKKILRLFLDGSKQDRLFCFKQIRHSWDKVFEPKGIHYKTHRKNKVRLLSFYGDDGDGGDDDIDITQLSGWGIPERPSPSSPSSLGALEGSKHGRSVATGQPAEKPTGTAPNPCEAAGA